MPKLCALLLAALVLIPAVAESDDTWPAHSIDPRTKDFRGADGIRLFDVNGDLPQATMITRHFFPTVITLLSLGLTAVDDMKVVRADDVVPLDIQYVVAVKGVCAWPNLTLTKDGEIIAVLHNQPAHGTQEGDVECWASRDGLV